MTEITTVEQAEDIAALDLHEEAIAALGRGESVRYHCERAGNSGESIETLIVGDRAGQAQGGDSAWGEWNDKDQTITMDDGECPCGCLGVTELDGSTACTYAIAAYEAAASAAAERAVADADSEITTVEQAAGPARGRALEPRHRLTAYLVYRHGSNASNQSMRELAPVAIVLAPSLEAACETDGDETPTIHSSLWLKLAPDVDCWSNQRFSAVPLSRAPRADVREVQEEEAIRGV